ncbi:hypothetical protein GGI20_004426 [Coemansia sp. BCRC 34301]|nr:hypothetical protein GGI20_004426 [Coemansia sp. BCRC 34301]
MVTPKQMRPALRCDILCVFVIESTQHMQNLFPDLYDSVLTKIITQLRTPVIVDSPSKKDAMAKKGATSQPTKATPCVRLGVVFFGDYYPYSTRTCSTKYFTSNYREFAKTIKEHRFCGGGRLRCAATEGLVGALEMLDNFNECDPEAGLTSVQQRHVILVSSTPPYAEPCRENDHVRYDGFGLDNVAARMRELKLSFSLVLERGKRIEQIENLLKTANVSTKPALELPKSMCPSFEAHLVGIDLPIAQESVAASLAPVQPAAMPLQANAPMPAAPVHIQPAQPQAIPAIGPSPALPQKNKVDANAMSVDPAMGSKKIKADIDAPSAGPISEDQAKAARGGAKSRQKTQNASRPKAARASNSPAVAAMAAPTVPQTNVANAMGGIAANPLMAHQHQLPPSHPMLQQLGGNPTAATGPGMTLPQQPAQAANPGLSQTIFNIKQSLINQGITSEEHHQIVIDLCAQCQNPAKTQNERDLARMQLENVMSRLKLVAQASAQAQTADSSATAAIARTISHQSSASTPQQQQQQQQVQGIVSPPTQPVELPHAALQQLLQHALNAIRIKQNIDIRQLLNIMTPDLFEAYIRDACRDQPDIINNVASLKFAFNQVKVSQAAQLLKQQQLQQAQQHMANQSAQLASPNGVQATSVGQQGHPTPVQAASQGPPNTLWRGTLVWESTPSNNVKHESFCQIAAFVIPNINYTAQELNLGEWPEQMRIKLMVGATEVFAENCVRQGIQMVRIGPSPNADQDALKCFEDFCATMRDRPLYALAHIGTMKPTTPFTGIFLTYFRNHLVGLPFFHRPITDAVMQMLHQHSLPSVAVHPHQAVSGGGSAISGAAQQMTPQPVVSGLPAAGALNASAVLARNVSVASATQQTAAAQQIMSPQQSLAVRPSLSSPNVANAASTNMLAIANVLQSRLTHEQLEMIRNLPGPQRESTIATLVNQALNENQITQQQQLAQLQQASQQQQLAQLLANQQHMQQQQHILGNMSALNPAMFSAASQQGGMAAFSSQPQMSNQLVQQQQQQQQQQHRPS